MATALELCAQLGFLDTSHEGPSRGLPKFLLDDMKKYAKFRQFVEDAALLADAYLYVANAGEKHWPSAEIPQWGFLAWGVDTGRIKELVTALFDLIMNSEGADRVVIDLEEDDAMTSNEGNEQQAGDFQTLPAAERAQTATGIGQSHIGAIQVGDHTMTAHGGTKQPMEESQNLLSAESDHRAVESVPSQLVVSQVPGPITRLARKDPDLIWNLLDAGHTEPFPVIANTEAELMDVLDDWMITHLDRSPPGTRKVNTESLGRTYINSLTFDTTFEEVRIEKRQILGTLMVYILKDADGSCMLVEPDRRKRGSVRAYFAWLGGDLGFTENVIASSVTLNKPQSKIEGARGRNNENDVINNPQGDALNTRPEHRPSAVRQDSLRGRQHGRRTDAQRWRYNSPSASSPDTGRKRYWPPQYVSPSPSQQRKKLRSHSPGERRRSSRLLASPVIDLDRTPLPERGTSIIRTSGREQGHVLGSYKLTGLSSKPSTVPVKDPYDASKASRPSGLRRSTRSQTTPAAGVRDTVFHFFLSDETLGAIPVPFRDYQTWDQFYGQALAAWNLLGNKARAADFVAVSVIIEGAEWPIVLPWRSSLAYMSMVESVADANARNKGGLQVQVRCIKR